jgi:hypothetical protein
MPVEMFAFSSPRAISSSFFSFNFVIAEITPITFVTINFRYYIVYAVIAASVAVLFFFFFPETRGLLLEEMDNLFPEPEHWWHMTSYSSALRKCGVLELETSEKMEVVRHIEEAEN